MNYETFMILPYCFTYIKGKNGNINGTAKHKLLFKLLTKY